MAVPTRSDSIDTLYLATWQIRKKKIIDAIFEVTPFYYQMTKQGRMDSQSGGKYIEVPINYGKNTSIQFISKGQNVTLTHDDTLTAAKYEWKYLWGHLFRYMVDDQQNKGKSQWIKKVNHDLDVLKDSLVDRLEELLFGDATGDDGKALNGLGNLVPEDPTTGTIGDLNRATYSWWRSQYNDMTGLEISPYLLPRMLSMWNDCGKLQGSQRFPDIIICSQAVHEAYNAECFEIGRIAMPDKGMMDLGFGDLSFKGAPITWSPQCPDYAMFMLNTSTLQFLTDPGVHFSLGDWLPIVDQPGDKVAHNLTACNLCINNPAKNGRIFNIGA